MKLLAWGSMGSTITFMEGRFFLRRNRKFGESAWKLERCGCWCSPKEIVHKAHYGSRSSGSGSEKIGSFWPRIRHGASTAATFPTYRRKNYIDLQSGDLLWALYRISGKLEDKFILHSASASCLRVKCWSSFSKIVMKLDVVDECRAPTPEMHSNFAKPQRGIRIFFHLLSETRRNAS